MTVLEEKRALSVSQLTAKIHSDLEESFPDVWVEGEVSDPRTFPSGHTYFTLKDAQSQLSAVLFKGDGGGLKFKLEHGLTILARGRVSMYRPRGQLQFIASFIQPKSAGALELAFQQLKAKLEKEGLFDPERKKPIPAFPERIGIVTSLQGAAIRDMLSVLNRRFEGLHIRIYPVPVQGEGASAKIAEAIEDFNRLLPETDVLLVGRGGGSLEDLWAFNEEVLARAIAASAIPVISCVGHETDFTIADFVADLRAPTPSAAAELVVPDKAEVLGTLRGFAERLPQALLARVRHAGETLRHLIQSPTLRDPRRLTEDRARRIDELQARLLAGPMRVVEDRRKTTAELDRRLEPAIRALAAHTEKDVRLQMEKLHALSPLACLSRGYSIPFTEDDRVLRSAKAAKPGQKLRLKLHDGEIFTEVKEKP
ncbi:MAG: exodeoxyribonuclease VII large subunit [Elusimicrobia bacterium]|nr:exodeoxyribonuclease VII large subunit [Elusimicrobiota bacterium]